MRKQRLHPVLSNLPPEGALREWFAQLASDLPGALVAEPVAPDPIPEGVLDGRPQFSLAGVQMKFSMHEADGRFNFTQPDKLGDWIVKTPSTLHRDVPVNEYTVMKLAELVGVEIPEIKLVGLDQNVQQMAQRLLVNILLGNGDAHLKNWSLIYPDRITAELAPAYDIVYTQAYIPGESKISLNLAGSKDWYLMNMGHFEAWAKRIEVPWRAIKPHLDDVMERSCDSGPSYLRSARYE